MDHWLLLEVGALGRTSILVLECVLYLVSPTER